MAVCVNEEEIRLIAISKLFLERLCRWVVNIQVHETDSVAILCFEPMHDGLHRLARGSPEGEELNELGPAGGKAHRGGIRRPEVVAGGRRGSFWLRRRPTGGQDERQCEPEPWSERPAPATMAG